jgi:hypothetical protein
MRYLLFIVVILTACGNAVVNAPNPSREKNKYAFEPVAVIELFTSQGCSSCPGADALLAATVEDAAKENKKIFALSFHVDYWNRLGWADPFSSAAFSQRQNNYVSSMGLNGAYTPQMIVNGSNEFVGSDKRALESNLKRALNTAPVINFSSLTADQNNGTGIKVHYTLEGDIKSATVNFALVSLSETTVVKRGENGGRTLTNDNIVRQLITKNAMASGEIEFANAPVPAKENAAIIAFVQEKGFKIIGAAMTRLN